MINQQVAICALVDPNGRVLITQRPTFKKMPNLWEFPGGKVEEGELPNQALIRELSEELCIETSSSCLAPVTFVIHHYGDFNIILFLFICRKWEGIIRPLEGQQISWATKRDLISYKMPEANSYLVAILRDWI